MKTFSLRLLTIILVLSLTTPVQAGFDPGFEPVETDLKGTSEPIILKAPVLSPPPGLTESLVVPQVIMPKEVVPTVAKASGGGAKWYWWALGAVALGGIAAAAGGGGGGGSENATPSATTETGTVSGSW